MPAVTIERCPSYERDAVRLAVSRALASAIGPQMARLTGGRALVKPNLASAQPPERGVTTHPAVVLAVVDWLRDRACEVSVGDSPAGAFRGVRRVWENTGLLAACEAARVPLLNFEAGGWVERSVGGRNYRIARVIEEFDWIVNVPKFKTHILTLLTGAVKNVFGCVPGFGKSMFHVANPKPAAMSQVLVDVFSLVRPAVTLVDAVDAMDGNGPSSGRVRHLGFIGAGQDAVAVDAVLAAVVGLDPLAIPTTREAWTRGLGEARLEAIAINGAAVEDVTVSDFKVPSNWGFALLPNALARLAGRFFWARPVAGAGACTGCGDCARICAARAIKVADGKAVIDRSKCVSCLCCIEICPVGAIEARKSSLARLAT